MVPLCHCYGLMIDCLTRCLCVCACSRICWASGFPCIPRLLGLGGDTGTWCVSANLSSMADGHFHVKLYFVSFEQLCRHIVHRVAPPYKDVSDHLNDQTKNSGLGNVLLTHRKIKIVMIWTKELRIKYNNSNWLNPLSLLNLQAFI